MKTLLIPILFALGTALFWGSYGPTLANARSMAKPPEWSPFKPYVFIGVAYVVWAIIGGSIAMSIKGDNYDYSGTQSAARTWGFLAGSLGAFGAICLTSAVLTSKGNTTLVMPIVFGGAVTVNAIISLTKMSDRSHVSWLLYVGMAIAIVGICMVAAFTPHGPPPKTTEDGSVTSVESTTTAEGERGALAP